MKGLPAQKLIPISEIRDDIVVMKDGSLRMLLMASSINFALKSADEQTAVIMQYQNFLNTLDFSIQIFAQSTSLNIDPYLESLEKQAKIQTNELLRTQTVEYGAFIKNFVETARIMTKTFYISVPYSPTASITSAGGGIMDTFSGLFGGGASAKTKKGLKEEKFAEYKNQLWQRADVITSGLNGCGVHSAPLKTEELIELFYNLYNPGGGKAVLENLIQK
jgi:type IV secretory pathway VirB4 component